MDMQDRIAPDGEEFELVAEQMERLSRLIERESRRYPPDFEKRGGM
mgnify:FL=1